MSVVVVVVVMVLVKPGCLVSPLARCLVACWVCLLASLSSCCSRGMLGRCRKGPEMTTMISHYRRTHRPTPTSCVQGVLHCGASSPGGGQP